MWNASYEYITFLVPIQGISELRERVGGGGGFSPSERRPASQFYKFLIFCGTVPIPRSESTGTSQIECGIRIRKHWFPNWLFPPHLGGVLRRGPAHHDGSARRRPGAHTAAQWCGPARGGELVLHPGQGRQVLLHVDHLKFQVQKCVFCYLFLYLLPVSASKVDIFLEYLVSLLRIRIRDPVPFWPRDPVWVKNKDPDPG